MRRSFGKIGKNVFVLTLSVILASVTAGAVRAESTLTTVLQRGELLAGTVVDTPPSGSMDAQGHIIGYAPDVARYIAARLGVKLQFVQVTAESRIPLLKTHRIDAEFGVTTPQKVRNEVVDFTYSYIIDSGVILVRKGESTNPADYYNSGKVIGATQGNGFVAQWQKLSPNAKFRLFQSESDVATALEQGDVDAHLVGDIAAHRYAAQSDGRLVVGGTFAPSPDAIMVNQDDSKWRNWLNWALQRMWVEGTLQKLYQKWYGIEPNFSLGDNGMIQPRVMEIGKTDDPWQPLPADFLQQLLGKQSYTLAN
jgi:polar amino acid transport system substrate-binding protein